MRAWYCFNKALNSGGFYAAETRSKARFESYSAAKECGYPVKFGDIEVRRAPQYDHITTGARRCLGHFSGGVPLGEISEVYPTPTSEDLKEVRDV